MTGLDGTRQVKSSHVKTTDDETKIGEAEDQTFQLPGNDLNIKEGVAVPNRSQRSQSRRQYG